MDEEKCPFCGSDKIRIETPFIDMHGKPQTTFCCLAQKNNQKYIDKHTGHYSNEKPTRDEVSKW